MKVTVIGGGSWGTTIAHKAVENGHECLLLLRDPAVEQAINRTHENPRYLPGRRLHPDLKATRDMEFALYGPQLVVIAVPSSAMASVIRQVGRFLDTKTPVISATKGLSNPGLVTMSAVISRYIPNPVGALGGPNLSQEILSGQPTASVIASKTDRVIELGRSILMGPAYRVYGSHDLTGVQLAGALKNIYAIGSGIAEGLGFGLNAKGFYLTRALAEMERLGRVLGAQPISFRGIAGMGDLFATANSTLSRNFRLGLMLARGIGAGEAIQRLGQVAEGAATVMEVHDFIQQHEVDMPQAEGICRVIQGMATPMQVVGELMRRKRLTEEY